MERRCSEKDGKTFQTKSRGRKLYGRDSRAIWILREEIFGNDFAVDEMFLDDAFQNGGRTGVVPGSFGINDGDWTICANAKAIDFAAINQRMRSDEI